MMMPPLGSFAEGFVSTHLALEAQQERTARNKLEMELTQKEMKLREKRLELEDQKLLSEVKLKQRQQQAETLLMMGLLGPQGQTPPAPAPADPLQGMTFTADPVGDPTGNAPYTAPPNPVLRTASTATADAGYTPGAGSERPVSGLQDPYAQMPPHVRQSVALALQAGHKEYAHKLLEAYLPQPSKPGEGQFTIEHVRYDANGKVIVEGPRKPEAAKIDYGLGDKLDGTVFRLFGAQLPPGSKPTPQMVAVAQRALTQEELQQDVTKAVAVFNATLPGRLAVSAAQGSAAAEKVDPVSSRAAASLSVLQGHLQVLAQFTPAQIDQWVGPLQGRKERLLRLAQTDPEYMAFIKAVDKVKASILFSRTEGGGGALTPTEMSVLMAITPDDFALGGGGEFAATLQQALRDTQAKLKAIGSFTGVKRGEVEKKAQEISDSIATQARKDRTPPGTTKPLKEMSTEELLKAFEQGGTR